MRMHSTEQTESRDERTARKAELPQKNEPPHLTALVHPTAAKPPSGVPLFQERAQNGERVQS